MHILETNDQQFKFVAEWKDLTIAKFDQLCQVPIPDKLKTLWLATISDKEEEWTKANDQITEENQARDFPEYYGKVMEVLTSMPPEIIEKVEWRLRTDFYNEYLHHFTISTLYDTPMVKDDDGIKPYNPPEIDHFMFRDHRYELPKSLRVLGQDIPMADEPVVSFAEATDIEIAMGKFAESGSEKLNLIIALYCRKKDEPYDQRRTIIRAKHFNDLDMEIAWSVFFCITELTTRFVNDIRKFGRNGKTRKKSQRQRPQTLTVLK